MAYWQHFGAPPASRAPYRESYPAPMPDGAVLDLPLRDFSDFAVAGLIANQASFPVIRRLAAFMTEAARPLQPEVVVGLPSLGQVFAPLVAEALGHANWVAPGWSRKRWYEERLSVPVHSITSPTPRRLWLDPRILDRLAGRRVLLVDDVISTGTSALAGLDLLAAAGVTPVGLLVAMAQGHRWQATWPVTIPTRAAFATPIFRPSPAGWLPEAGTVPHHLCLPLPAEDHAA
ncbi:MULTISPECIES: phosphoribosyltransferase [Roseomonadaceae]|uniref:Phosphoribosyltransferase n=1 Tax=Falsiroseomonas oleicola TaxID=2801474 RepID=A0ABS6H8P4_9PROT|nr:phosphoribosyltransferase [Roseomonas oleicola]MBU8545073.1 phosphoribosyltransferase [Roseomonas oleicola]